MPRFSILGLVGLVVVCATAFAALRAANDGWAGGILLLTLTLLGFETLRAIRGRASALGFVVFCGGYFVAVHSLSISEVGSLPTSLLLDQLAQWWVPPTSYVIYNPNTAWMAVSPLTPNPPPVLVPLPLPSPSPVSQPVGSATMTFSGLTPLWVPSFNVNAESFRNIGQNLMALLFGGIGALGAHRFRSRPGGDQAGSTQGS